MTDSRSKKRRPADPFRRVTLKIVAAVLVLGAASPVLADPLAPAISPRPSSAAHADIETALDLLASLVDRSDYDALARILADEVRLDYTSLWGGEPSTQTREQVLAAWSGLLPGFDATRHVFGDYDVTINGNAAAVEGHGVATHWLGDEQWMVGGRYRWTLIRDTHGWKINGVLFDVSEEEGDRGLTSRAAARVSR